MTVEREAFIRMLDDSLECWRQGYLSKRVEVIEKAVAYAAAERLAEHVRTCRVRSPMRSPYERDGHRACGDKWYCEDAPIKEPVKGASDG